MADKVVARPLITIANVIWSFNPLNHLPQVLLVKRAYPPFEGHWALPETLLRRDESADVACIRLIKDKIGVRLSNSATEQFLVGLFKIRIINLIDRCLAESSINFAGLPKGKSRS